MASFPSRGFRRGLVATTLLIIPAGLACSLILGTDATQCSSDRDCARFGAYVCDTRQNLCVPQASSEGGAPDASRAECWDPAGFGGHGCYKCAPTTGEELLNACAKHAFVHFDNPARITGFDPANPIPPLPPAEAGPPVEAGSQPDAGGPDASPGDASPGDAAPDGPPPVPRCPPLTTLKNPIVLVASTGFLLQPTLDALATTTLGEVSIVWKVVGSCDGASAMIPGGPAASGEVTLLRPQKEPFQCALDTAFPADIGGGGLFWETCNPDVPQPPDIQDVLGAVNPVSFIAPVASKESGISAEAAYRVYGFGNRSGVMPWSDEDLIFRRNARSGNQTAVALALGLPADRFVGIDSNGGSNMAKLVEQGAKINADATIGISSSEVVDKSREVVKMLAYQHMNQRVGFFWDSDPAAFDRRAVRDGHYFFWVAIHVFARVSSSQIVGGNPSLDAVRPRTLLGDMVNYLTIRRPLPGVNIFKELKDPRGGAAAIPQCAMRVTRKKDSGMLEPFTPPRSCGCAFESAPPGTAPPECKKCEQSGECPKDRPVCSFEYCEPN